MRRTTERLRDPRAFAPLRHEWLWVTLLLLAQTALTVWGAARNSVTFDENYHVPDGVEIVARGDFRVSPFNPPLVKAAGGALALAAGARVPPADSLVLGDQLRFGEAFMRLNRDRYHRVFFAARLVTVLLAALLALLVWAFARRLWGPRGALIALGLFAFSAETLAHGGVATGDVATALGLLATVYGFWGFSRSGRRGWWVATAFALGFALLVRFTSLVLFPVLGLLALLATATGGLRRPGRVWAGLVLLVPAALLLLHAGYLFHTRWSTLGDWEFLSRMLLRLQHLAPWMPVPLPTDYVLGFDYQSYAGQEVGQETFLFSKISPHPLWYYYPVALALKWPLAFLAAIPLRAWLAHRAARRPRLGFYVTVPPLLVLAGPMVVMTLDIGVRYVYPLVPFLCVWLGGLWPTAVQARAPKAFRAPRRAIRAGGGLKAVAVALVILQAGEVLRSAPWYLSFFNVFAGGPGGGYRLLNDSNVDWGQGLIALREEMKRRGIERIHLCYHGTTDPAVYGIDYIPYFGGLPGPGSDWLAVSDYYFVGLSQRMMTSRGRTGFRRFDFRGWPLEPIEPSPAGCMQLFLLPHDRARPSPVRR